jgi:hypothetical protein
VAGESTSCRGGGRSQLDDACPSNILQQKNHAKTIPLHAIHLSIATTAVTT